MFIRTPHLLALARVMVHGLAVPGVQMNSLNGSGETANLRQVMGC